MKRTFPGLLLIAAVALSGCVNFPSRPENVVPPPATAAATLALPDAPTAAATAPALVTAAAEPTIAASPTDLPTPTPEPLPTEPPPTPTPAATETPTAEPSPTVIAADLMAPGQRDEGELTEGEFHSYLVQSTQFRPLIMFAEPSRDLDVELLTLVGELPAGSGLDSVTPASTANNALAGRPELVVLSPSASGIDTFVVRAASGSGSYAAYLYDLTSPATGMAVQQSDTLALGETKRYEVTSNGARPVIAMADPTNLSDLALDIYGSDGTLLTTANFSGQGGVEVAYVLPLGTQTYTIAVREVNGMQSEFDVAVVTME